MYIRTEPERPNKTERGLEIDKRHFLTIKMTTAVEVVNRL